MFVNYFENRLDNDWKHEQLFYDHMGTTSGNWRAEGRARANNEGLTTEAPACDKTST